MRTKLVLLCSVILLNSNLLYGRDVVNAARVSNSYGISTLPQTPVSRIWHAPSALGINIEIKNETGKPELSTAIGLAKRYLGEVLKRIFL